MDRLEGEKGGEKKLRKGQKELARKRGTGGRRGGEKGRKGGTHVVIKGSEKKERRKKG